MLGYYCSKRSKSRKTPMMMICEIFWSYKTKLSNSNNEKEGRNRKQNMYIVKVVLVFVILVFRFENWFDLLWEKTVRMPIATNNWDPHWNKVEKYLWKLQGGPRHFIFMLANCAELHNYTYVLKKQHPKIMSRAGLYKNGLWSFNFGILTWWF